MQKKKYIFFGQSILGNGGAQVYYLNKMKFLEAQGWDIILFTFHTRGTIVYKEFSDFYNKIFPELSLPLYYFTQRAIKCTVSKIMTSINCTDYDRVVIESNWLGSAEWAELISQKIRAKHVIYLLSEQNKLELSYDFLKFKFDRGELSGISYHVIESLFAPIESIPRSKIKPILAGCFSLSIPKNVNNSNLDNLHKDDYDYVISYFGRIEKLTPNNLNEVCAFARIMKRERVLFLGMGYNTISELDKFTSVIKKAPKNIDIHIIPSNPIVPLSFFEISDVIIASAGCARIALRQNKFTITIDTDNDEVIGVLGLTTMNTTSSQIKSSKTICNILFDILVNQLHDIKDLKDDNYEIQCESALNEHIAFINSDCPSEYFNLHNRLGFRFDKYHIRLFVIKLLGIKMVELIRKIKHSMI